MSGRIVSHPINGRQFHVGGCLQPPAGHPAAMFARFKTPAFPAIPDTYDLTAAAKEPLGEMWGNDTTGNCVPVAIFRNSAVKLCNVGAYSPPYQTADVWRFYSGNTGFVPGDEATDQGSDPVSALQYAQKNGLMPGGMHAIEGFFTINGKDPHEVREAIWLFEGVMATANLPDAFVSSMPSASGFTFDACGPSDPEDGHGFFLAPKFNPKAVDMSTWGMEGDMTDAALAQYCDGTSGAIYVILTRDMIDKAKAKAPNGLDWAAVESYCQAMRQQS